ncbi:MAG: redox-sensing transcriptional repressor Rex [Lachnospiraceae bacterium]|nr:redox-sensing transcriptional repressor Rex [Lachnospiraceae bacterium]
MEAKKFSKNMLARMPIYLNYIKSLPESTKNISATKIANALGLGEVSVRKDLAKVSDGGRCKLGYVCEELINDIENFLDVKSVMNTIIVGKGDMLPILLGYEGFEESGVNVIAGFDVNSRRVRSSNHKSIYPMDELKVFCTDHQIRMAILMVSPEDAQEICNQLISCGIEAIWNFTSVFLDVPEHIVVRNENITTSVIELRMQLKERSEAF